MKDPGLPAEQFTLDCVVTSAKLFGKDDFASIEGAHPEEQGVAFLSPGKLVLTLRPPYSDLSGFNGLSLKAVNRSSGPLLAGIKLIHGSQTLAKDTYDVSFSGGREDLSREEPRKLKFPLESFGSYGTPEGWADIREIEITFTREKNEPEPFEIRVSLSNLKGELREIPAGPRLTEAGLAGVLRQDISGVTAFFGSQVPISGAASSGRADRGLDAFSLGDTGLFIPPPHSFPSEGADAIARGRIMGHAVGIPPCWKANPLGIQEWTHFLNRHHFTRELVQALVHTNDEKYAQALDELISDWILTNPVPVGSNGGAGPPWETLSAAWRLREWLWVMGIAWPHPAFRQKTKMQMLCSIWEHAWSLMDHRGHPNNWLIVESAALSLAGICFPEFREAGLWTETGVRRLTTELRRQFFDDGVHFEISPLYHAICLHATLEVRRGAAASNLSLPEEFGAALERAAEFLAALCRPDFTWPSINDSGGAAGDYSAVMRLAGETFQRPDFVRIGSHGQDGKGTTDSVHRFVSSGAHSGPMCLTVRSEAPIGASVGQASYLSTNDRQDACPTKMAGEADLSPPSGHTGARIRHRNYETERLVRVFPSAGIVTMRSHHGRDADFLVFRAGPPGGFHFHGDRLSLDVTTNGTPALVDPGITTYAPGLMTNHYRSPAAHNTILVDGKGPDVAALSFAERIKPAGSDLTCTSADGLDIASGSYAGPWNRIEVDIAVRRDVVFVRREYWIVRDVVTGAGVHEITVCWQFAPGRVDIDLKTYASFFSDPRGPGLEIAPVLGLYDVVVEMATGSIRPPRGWVSMSGADFPATTCRYTVAAELPMTLVWLLVPFVGPRVKPVRTDRDEGFVQRLMQGETFL